MTIDQQETGPEGGFTLIEVLLTVVVSGIMISALTLGIMTYMKGAGATTALLRETGELQIAASYFATDVQSSELVTSVTCNTTPATSGTAFVNLDWKDWTSATAWTPVRVSYYHDSATNQVHRVACRNGSVDKSTLVTHVQPGTSPSVLCDGGGCALPSAPQQVDLKLFVCTVDPVNACRNDPIPVTLTGVRRL